MMNRLCFCNTPQSLKEFSQGVEKKTTSKRQLLWRSIEQARTNWYLIGTRNVKKQFNQESDILTDKIRSSLTAALSIDASISFFSDNALLENWEQTLTGIHLPVAESFGSNTLENLKCGHHHISKKAEAFDLWNNEVLNWIQNNAATKISQITDTTKKLVRNALQEGIDNGESVELIAQRIDDLYLKQIIPFRSEVIARTEVIAASNLGSRAAALHTGLLLNHSWLASGGKRTRFDHAAANGQEQKMRDPYIVGGELLMFPGDTSLGASAGNIIQCRCAETFQVATKGI